MDYNDWDIADPHSPNFKAYHAVAEALAAELVPLVRLTDEELEQIRHRVFSTSNPFCPCDSKTMKKAGHSIIDAMQAKNSKS